MFKNCYSLIFLPFLHGVYSAILDTSHARIPNGLLNLSELGSHCQLSSSYEHHGIVNDSSPLWPYQTYKSSPHNPPELEIVRNSERLSPGFLLIGPGDTNLSGPIYTRQPAPMIMTDSGQLVWMGETSQATISNFHVADYLGSQVLVYWKGITRVGATFGNGWGRIIFLDSGYNQIMDFCPRVDLVTPDGSSYDCDADVHESRITKRNTLLWLAYNITRADLSGIGGPSDGWIWDNVIYETDLQTGAHLFRWSAAEHVPIDATRIPTSSLVNLGTARSNALSYFQANGVTEAGDGYLLCSRHTSSVFLLDRSGSIRWRLDGVTGGDFGPLPQGANFNWQHDARALTPLSAGSTSMTISLLDNGNAPFDRVGRPSRAVVLFLSFPSDGRWSVELISETSDQPDSLESKSQGSVIRTPSGNWCVGYGVTPVLREFGPTRPGWVGDSDLRWEARFGLDDTVASYRFYKQTWSGLPDKSKPRLALAKGSQDCLTAFVSWNGATNVEAWRVYQGDSPHDLAPVGDVPYRGFETRFDAMPRRFVQVAAVHKGGEIRRSNVVQLK